jgi:hypothetical protein
MIVFVVITLAAHHGATPRARAMTFGLPMCPKMSALHAWQARAAGRALPKMIQ